MSERKDFFATTEGTPDPNYEKAEAFRKKGGEAIKRIAKTGDKEALYELRERWADLVSCTVFGVEPSIFAFQSKRGDRHEGKYAVPVGDQNLYCSRQIEELSMNDRQRNVWEVVKGRMARVAVEGLVDGWTYSGIKDVVDAVSGDDEKRKLVQKWVGGPSGPLAGLEQDILDRLPDYAPEKVVVEDDEIGFDGGEREKEGQIEPMNSYDARLFGYFKETKRKVNEPYFMEKQRVGW